MTGHEWTDLDDDAIRGALVGVMIYCALHCESIGAAAAALILELAPMTLPPEGLPSLTDEKRDAALAVCAEHGATPNADTADRWRRAVAAGKEGRFVESFLGRDVPAEEQAPLRAVMRRDAEERRMRN